MFNSDSDEEIKKNSSKNADLIAKKTQQIFLNDSSDSDIEINSRKTNNTKAIPKFESSDSDEFINSLKPKTKISNLISSEEDDEYYQNSRKNNRPKSKLN